MPKRVTEFHHELVHYTTGAGLVGIVATGSLWATHASALNDSQEIIHFLDTRLIEIVREETIGVLTELVKNPEAAHIVQADGGFDKVAEQETTEIAKMLRESMLTFHQPHIFSLSAVANDRVRNNGLLSQWRGYGSDGGYAIVFDSAKFEELLYEEVAEHHYQHMQWGDVYYYGLPSGEHLAGEEVAEAESKLRAGIRELLQAPKPSSMEQSYDAMITLSCLYKNWGFYEEQEVRVIAIPPNTEVQQMAESLGETKIPRNLSFISRGGTIVPYLELFSGLRDKKGRLPIKRVIVGPHPLSSTRLKSVKILLESNGYDAESCISDISYLGR